MQIHFGSVHGDTQGVQITPIILAQQETLCGCTGLGVASAVFKKIN
jgi:hypothetical protein